MSQKFQVFAWDRRSRFSRFPDFAGAVEFFSTPIVAATMVIVDETEDTPRRVSVKSTQCRLTFAHHPGANTRETRFSWKKKKPAAKKKNAAAVEKK